MIDDRFKSFQKRYNEDVTWGVNDEIGFILYIFMGFWEGQWGCNSGSFLR